MPVEPNPGLVIGASMFFAGMLTLFVVLAKNGGLAFGTASLTNISKMMSDPERAGAKRVFLVALFIACTGGLVTCGSVAAGDAKRNKPCKEACKAKGYKLGRFRGDPHRPVSKGRVDYKCWCQGEQGWSSEPMEL